MARRPNACPLHSSTHKLPHTATERSPQPTTAGDCPLNARRNTAKTLMYICAVRTLKAQCFSHFLTDALIPAISQVEIAHN